MSTQLEFKKLKNHSDINFQTDIDKLRTRIQEITDSYNDLEVQVAQVQSESKDLVEKSNQDNDGREKLLEAKIEDLGDRLRLGMGKLQQAIGETSASVNGKNNHFDVILLPHIFSLLIKKNNFCFYFDTNLRITKCNWKTLKESEKKFREI